MSSSGVIVRCIEGAREGSVARLDELLGICRNYLRVLAAACLHRDVRGKVDASDVVQETLMKAHQRFGQFRGNTELEWLSWIRRILVHHIADLHRRYRLAGYDVEREKSLEEAMDRSSAVLSALASTDSPSPSEHAEQRETGVVLADVLAELDPDDREIVILRNMQGMDWIEVGVRTARSPDAARMRWTRALQQLGTRLRQRLP